MLLFSQFSLCASSCVSCQLCAHRLDLGANVRYVIVLEVLVLIGSERYISQIFRWFRLLYWLSLILVCRHSPWRINSISVVSIVDIHIKLIDQSPLVNDLFLLSFNDLHVFSEVLLVFMNLFDVQLVLLVDFSQMMTV